jgi:hypothetical protein
MVIHIAIQRGWATKQVDLSNAFVQATLEEKVYGEVPAMFAMKRITTRCPSS